MLASVRRGGFQAGWWSAGLVLLAGCAVDRTVGTWRDGGADGGGFSRAGWGAYTAALPVPACPPGERWVVDSTDALLEGGPGLSERSQAGPTLSLREALHLAFNRPGPDVVEFDPAVFPDDAPATIELGEAPEGCFPSPLEEVCLDARGRGVIVRWGAGVQASRDFRYELVVGRGSLLVGLQLLDAPSQMRVAFGQIAGTRFSIPYRALYVGPSALVGPGNAFGDGTMALETFVTVDDAPPTIRGNAFGRDPVNGDPAAPRVAMHVFDEVLIEENVVVTSMTFLTESAATAAAVVRRNHFAGPVSASVGTGWTLGPDNVFLGGLHNVHPAGARGNTVTRNLFRAAEDFRSTDEVAPLTAASAGSAAGACPADGGVELYADTGDGGALVFLADGPCLADGGFEVAYPALPSGATLRTLFTHAATRNTGGFSAPMTLP